jgi:uncharacterized protein (DUF305 family)
MPDDSAEQVALPWWRSPLNLTVLAVAVAVLAGGIGWVVGNNGALSDPNATDVGFLQDMRYHHEQAIDISRIYLEAGTTNADLRTIANEIIVGQGIEIGRMIQLLRDFGKPETNQNDVAMAWMGESIALDRMPGLATDADLAALQAANGTAADKLFVQLMTAHHQGGIHMAQDAAKHAATSEVRGMATSMVTGQTGEISEMATLAAKIPA